MPGSAFSRARRASASMNRPDAASSSVSMTSAPSSSATLVPRTNAPQSPIQEITSSSRSSPVAISSCCWRISRPPTAPPARSRYPSIVWPRSGCAKASHESAGSSPAAPLPSATIGKALISEAGTVPSKPHAGVVGVRRDQHRLLEDLAELAERRGPGHTLELLEEPRHVHVHEAEPVLGGVLERVLVALVVLDRLAALRGVDRGLHTARGAEHEPTLEHGGRPVRVVRRDVQVMAAVVGLARVARLLDRVHRRVLVLGRHEHRRVRVVPAGGDTRHEERRLVAQPGLDVVAVGEAAAGLREGLLHQTADPVAGASLPGELRRPARRRRPAGRPRGAAWPLRRRASRPAPGTRRQRRSCCRCRSRRRRRSRWSER